MASLFQLFGKKKRGHGLVGLNLCREGVALAHVLPGAERPRLNLCVFQEASGEEAQHAALRELVTTHGLEKAACAGVLEPQQYKLLMIDAPSVGEDELKAAVRWQIKDMLDSPMEETAIDAFSLPPQRGGNMSYAVAAPNDAVQRQAALMTDCKLQVEAVDIAEMALRNIAHLDPEDERGITLLHFSCGSAIITISHQGLLTMTRGMELRRADFARLEEGLAQTGPLSEDAPIPYETLGGAQDPLDRIVLELQRSLDYQERHFDFPPPKALRICPVGHVAPLLLRYLSENLGLKATPLDINTLLECREPVDLPTQSRCLSAVGAALRHHAEGEA